MEYYKAIVQSIDFDLKTLECKSECDAHDGKNKYFHVKYDRLVLAPGCVTNTFNTPGAVKNAFFLRDVSDARAVQYRLQQLLERAAIPGTSEEE